MDERTEFPLLSLSLENLFKGPIAGGLIAVVWYALSNERFDMCTFFGYISLGTVVGGIVGPWILVFGIIFVVVRHLKNKK